MCHAHLTQVLIHKMCAEMRIKMKIDFFGLFSVEALYVILGMAGITIIAIILAIVAICKSSKMKKKYNEMLQGSDGESIEKLIKDNISDIEKLKQTSESNTKAIKDIYVKLQSAFQKIGIVKYDAFNEMGGKLSYALCMLDKQDNGYLLNVMHSNAGCFSYIKEIVNGKSYIELGGEEQKALEQAIAGRQGDVDLGKKINDMIQADVDPEV